MKDLAHHKYVSPFKQGFLDSRIAYREGQFAAAIAKRPAEMASSPGSILSEAGLALHEGRPSVTRRFLMLGAEIAAAVCAASFRTGDVSFSYNGETVTGPGGVPEIPLSPQTWIENCFDFVVLSRRQDFLDVVLAYPQDYLRRAGGERDEFGYTLVETLRAFARRDPRWKDLAVETERNMEPDRVTIAPAVWIAMDRARLGLLRAVDSGSAEALDAALIGMIKAHKKVYGRGAEAKNAGGLLCLPALAFAAIAHDRGIRTTVQSDYMPLWLVRGEDPPA